MTAMYTIAGRQVGSHVLAMATLGSLGALGFFSLGGSSAKKSQGPPINAQSPDEEKFIKDFLAQAEQDGKNSHGNNVDATKKDAGR